MTFISATEVKYLNIELSSHCNAACSLCPRQTIGTNTEHPNLVKANLTFDQVKSLIDSSDAAVLAEMGIDFSGSLGDPMMNPEIIQIVEYCATKVRAVRISTNGSLQPLETWAALGKISAAYAPEKVSIMFGIDGLSDTNAIYRVNTDFDAIMANATAYIAAGGFATWKYLIFAHNEHQTAAAQTRASELGFSKFVSVPAMRWFPGTDTPGINKCSELVNQADQRQFAPVEGPIVVECQSTADKTLFVGSDFMLYPCAYSYSSRLLLSDEFNASWNNKFDLSVKTIAEYLADDFFVSKLPSSWSSNPNRTCGKKCNQNMRLANISRTRTPF